MLTSRSFSFCSTFSFLIAAAIPAAPSNLQAEDATQKAIDFCDRALLRDRGVANTDFAGKSDDWLMMHFILNKKLRQQMNVTPNQLRQLTLEATDYATMAYILKMSEKELRALTEEVCNGADGASTAINGKPTIAADAAESDQRPSDTDEPLPLWNPKTQAAFKTHLPVSQLNRLDLLYLNLEGLSAIVRPNLAKRLALYGEQCRKIVSEINTCRENDSLPLHRVLFTLNKGNTLTEAGIERQLRRVSQQLDKKILKHLDAKQITALAQITDNAKAWEPLTVNPGIGTVTATEIKKAGTTDAAIKDKST